MQSLALPSIANAKLPAIYEDAKTALAECSRIDECATWANKAEAMASYAKQAGDDTMRKTADRIQARAIRRCGELLSEIKSSAGRPKNGGGGHTKSQAARDAGLSRNQKNTALRVAAVPQLAFEEAVESDDPPTVTKLAEAGTQKKPAPVFDLQGRDPHDFQAATAGHGQVRRLAEFARTTEAAAVVRGSRPHEIDDLIRDATIATDWLETLLSMIHSEHEDVK